MLKRCDNKVIMIYKKYQNKYELPDRELEIYSVDSFTFLESTNIGRCPSAHINRVPRAVYTDTDPAPSVQLIIITLTLMIQFAKKTLMIQVLHMSHISRGLPTQDGRTKPHISKESLLHPQNGEHSPHRS